ncbi:histidinol-phosphatase [Campylobacterota bacterium DY0563]
MKVDLHNHTYLCKHAVGIMDDYIKKAIKEKIDVLGFSDHNPMKYDKKHRMENKYKKDYIQMFENAKMEYNNKIKLLFAYEFDYLDYGMNKKLLKDEVDYLIGSVHFLDQYLVDDPKMIKEYKKGKNLFKNVDATTLWNNYFEQIRKMAKTEYFNIVGHIDLVKILTNEEPKKDIRLIAKDALKQIKKSGMAVEINASGLRKSVKDTYPSKKLLEEIYAYDIPITFGSDSHAVEHVGYKKDYCEKLAKNIGFTNCVYFEKKEMIKVKF